MGAPTYSPQRVRLIMKLVGTMPLDEIARTMGQSRDSLRVWARRHGVDLKMRTREPAPLEAQPGA
jgi:hypothetical protein